MEERTAMAAIEGGVPPVFALAFAVFQIGRPAGRTAEEWRLAIDDAGRFLDACGRQAEAMGWQSSDLFARDGLAYSLRGASVVSLNTTAATFSDGRTFKRTL